MSPVITTRRKHREEGCADKVKYLPRGDRHGIIAVHSLSPLQTEVLQQPLAWLLKLLIVARVVIIRSNWHALLVEAGRAEQHNKTVVNNKKKVGFIFGRVWLQVALLVLLENFVCMKH